MRVKEKLFDGYIEMQENVLHMILTVNSGLVSVITSGVLAPPKPGATLSSLIRPRHSSGSATDRSDQHAPKATPNEQLVRQQKPAAVLSAGAAELTVTAGGRWQVNRGVNTGSRVPRYTGAESRGTQGAESRGTQGAQPRGTQGAESRGTEGAQPRGTEY